jgi:hypothetical protein
LLLYVLQKYRLAGTHHRAGERDFLTRLEKRASGILSPKRPHRKVQEITTLASTTRLDIQIPILSILK